ncbi:MAG: rhodanese-like domain-containing protein [Rhodothermales bacterium]|nr:rhodanese-like domain-containing protein [Rhodothermales bacterium]MBO6781600.1 rhodanese-like domain-containing protein [Rhodothermales bacterium]
MFATSIPSIDVHALKARRQAGADPVLLDVRRDFEREIASLGGLHIEMSELPDRLEELESHRSDELIVYCRSGQRSARVVQYLQQHGFTGAVNLDGGVLAWSREIDPEMPQY